jgi:S1-C subfamily serine protease
MKPGDRIAALNGTPVWTFGDIQYQLDKVSRKAGRISLTVDRGGKPLDLAVALPPRWWWTDLRFRQSSVEPRTYFEDRPLSVVEKQKLHLGHETFASEVKYVADFARLMKTHDLKTGDIIIAVDGVDRDEVADTADLFIKLRRAPDVSVTLDVIRDGKRMQMPLKTYRMSFRK